MIYFEFQYIISKNMHFLTTLSIALQRPQTTLKTAKNKLGSTSHKYDTFYIGMVRDEK